MRDVLRIYRMMSKYWVSLVFGFLFMLAYALFSGVSITMVIPVFDYVFVPRDVVPIYKHFPEFMSALGNILSEFFAKTDSIGAMTDTSHLQAFLARLKEVLSSTDPLLLLYSVCGALIVLTLIKNIFFFCNKLMFANLRGKTMVDIRDLMFSKYLNQSMIFYQENKVGDSIVRISSDVSIMSELFIRAMFDVLRDLSLLFVYARIAILLNTRLFLMSLIVLPIFSIVMAFLGKKIKKYAKRIQLKFSDMFSNVEEVMSNMRIVKAFSREDHELNKFKEINNKFFTYWRKSVIYSAFNVPISEINGVMTGVLVVILGGRLVLAQDSGFSFGSFTAFMFAVFSMLHPMKNITKAYTEIKKALVSLDRVFTIINRKSEIIESENAITKQSFDKSIEYRDVSFTYNQKSEALKAINLTIGKGEKVALVGSSGSGKTTFVNLLPRMYDVSAGEILIDGINIKEFRLRDLRTLFGTVTQESILFSDTVANNISYGSLSDVSLDDIKAAARISYADEFIETLPGTYDAMLQQKGSNLSGGQRQRVCIARAIVGNPPILIFDEATSALDTEAEQKVQQAIDQATKNRTVIVIAHRLSTVLSADKIVVMDKGRIVDTGTHAELLEKCDRYRTLYNLQFKNSGGQ